MKSIPKHLSWEQTRYSPLKRQWEILSVTGQFLLHLAWDFLFGQNSSPQRHRRARWLVRKLVNLGPTFIKIGQALSTRPDLIPLEYIDEFSQLQDRVPPFLSEEAIAIVEKELGESVELIFKEFERIPLASASLGQVHKATLETGEEVVVKVQRRGLEKLFNLDFEVLHGLIRFANRFFPGFKKYDLELIYQEFFELLWQEIDYLNEGENANRFRENFKNYPHVIVPKVYWQYTTKRVLTLEYLPGIKINDREALVDKGINTDRIIQLGICAFLKQLLEDGFFQSDPHPGNMAVSKKGDLIFYDFGTMAEIKPLAKDQMIQTFFAVLRKDADQVLEMLIYMGLIETVPDMTPVRRLISFLLEKFRDKPVDVKAFKEISTEIYIMFEQQPFRLPPQMTFIVKSLTTLDGIARALDPHYNLLAASQPFVKNIATSGTQGNILTTIARQTKIFITNQLQKPSPLEIKIQNFESRLDQGEIQIRIRALESERTLKIIHLALKTLIYACLSGFSLLCAILLLSSAYSKWAVILFGLTGLFSFFLLRSLIKLTIQEKLYQQKG
jgi:predicted unusual protein kinase regulating ubiquinone biosynthesis (AarF/ABC1/UbiB family)